MTQLPSGWHEHDAYLNGLIAGAANAQLRRYHDYVEREDVWYELIAYVLSHPRKIAGWIQDEDERAIERALENEARAYCLREQAQRNGGDTSDFFFYHRAAIEDALPALWDDELRLNPTHAENMGHQTRRDPAEGGNWMASVADISRAFDALAPDQRALIEAYYRDGKRQAEIAEVLETSQPNVSRLIQQAIKSMWRYLGGGRPRDHRDCEECLTGTRRVLSNAEANAITKGQWEE